MRHIARTRPATKIGCLLLLVFFQCLNGTSAAESATDARVQAAITVLEGRNDIEDNFVMCRALAGEYGFQYEYAKYIWALQNQAQVRAAEKIFAALPASVTSDINQRWQRTSEAFRLRHQGGEACSKYFYKLASAETHNFTEFRTVLTPELSAADARILVRNADMEVGCIKNLANRSVKQVDAAKQACSCQMAILAESLTDQDIDDFTAIAGARKMQEAAAFLGKKTDMSKLSACYSKLAL
jgi:hypothetical protein